MAFMICACDCQSECRMRREAAFDVLVLASARLKDVILTGPEESVEAAHAALRLARVRFLAARAICEEVMKLAAAAPLAENMQGMSPPHVEGRSG
jgi:hypothetical protein